MPLFGAHMSVAGGLHNALLIAQRYGCRSVQLFSKNANQWNAAPLEYEQISLFRRTVRQTGLRQSIVHDSYLINLASPVEELRRRSIEAFVVEMERAEAIGARYLVTHPGAHLGSGEDEGLQRVAAALDEAHRRCEGYRLKVLLETTAGQGTTLGHRFEHLARIFDLVEQPRRLGVCLDTCHVFAAGYGLAPEPEYQATFRAFDRLIGLSRLKVFHVNDSLKPHGSRVDRHAHIGRGHLGLEPFRLLVNDPRFHNRPMVLETPKIEGDNEEMDAVNLQTLLGLIETPTA
jgi:deoxyribonuclease-4